MATQSSRAVVAVGACAGRAVYGAGGTQQGRAVAAPTPSLY